MPPLHKQVRWWILGLLFCVTVINFVDRQALSVLAPVIRDTFHLSNTQYGTIVSWFQFGMVVGEFPMGWLMDRVGVRLAAARSSRVYVHGPIRGRSRVVPYQGPETVIDMLKRIGGLPPGSKLNQVYVVRPNVAGGERPEVFRVDVAAVLIDDNHTTNVALKPSDEVYVGETRRSVVARMLPAWLGRAYRQFAGLLPDDWWPLSHPRQP